LPPDDRELAGRAGLHAKKKSLFAAEQERPDIKAQRDAWLDTLTSLCAGDFARVIFLDESGALTNLVRTYGRSDCGERCVGLAPQGHWKVMTAVAAVRLDGLTAPFTIDCPMDGEIFGVYVERVLVPALRSGDVVVMDNLTAHKRPQIKRMIEAAGARVLYLPPYSPDFNPIEMIWSKVKRLLRSLAARTVDALHHAFGQAFAAVTPGDIRGCFKHCGYATNEGAPL
jgi:transposase